MIKFCSNPPWTHQNIRPQQSSTSNLNVHTAKIDFTANVTANPTQPTQPPDDIYLPDAPIPRTFELTDKDYEQLQWMMSTHVSNNYFDRFIPINPSDPPPTIAADVNHLFPGQAAALDRRLRQITHAIQHCEQWSNALDPVLKSIISCVLDYGRYALCSGHSLGDPKWEERDLCRLVFRPGFGPERLVGIWLNEELQRPLPVGYEAYSESFL